MQDSSSYDLQESDIQRQDSRGQPVPESAASRSRNDSVDSGELKGVDLDAQAKAERTKAKNKRAQKKFRQKQKEKHEELERSAAELSAKLKVTLAELDALQNQKRVLEIALSRNIEPSDATASTSQVSYARRLHNLHVHSIAFQRKLWAHNIAATFVTVQSGSSCSYQAQELIQTPPLS